MSLTPTKTTPQKNAKFPILVSYAFLRDMKEEDIPRYIGNPKTEVLLDSGAFTALNAGVEIDLNEYMAFLKKWKHLLFGYMALDKLGDPVTTDRQLQIMLDEGLKPVPVHVRGDTEERMDQLFQWSDWVACGGFRRPHRGPAPKEYVQEKMKWAKGRNVHWLGYTTQPMLLKFKPYSCDCSSWTSAQQYGVTTFYEGKGVWSKTWQVKDARSRHIPDYIKKHLHECGFSLADFKNPDMWRSRITHGIPHTRFLSLQMSIYAWVRYIREFRAVHGTRIFMASLPIFVPSILPHVERTHIE